MQESRKKEFSNSWIPAFLICFLLALRKSAILAPALRVEANQPPACYFALARSLDSDHARAAFLPFALHVASQEEADDLNVRRQVPGHFSDGEFGRPLR